MIVSTLSGRMRVRLQRLKSVSTSCNVKKHIEALDGVTEVRTNPAAGSLVIQFNTDLIDVEHLEDQVEAIMKPALSRDQCRKKMINRKINQATKIGMLTSLAASLTYASMGKKKQHITYGKAFLGFACVHLFKHSKALLR